jgi:hypothetical protein
MDRFPSQAAEVAQRLACSALAVCQHYLPAGRREGRYWMVGNVAGEPGRSLYVRLFESERGKIGNWVDAATGEHGDLLDLIRLNQGHARLADAIEEARRFLLLPPSEPLQVTGTKAMRKAASGSQGTARRLYAAAGPIPGTLAARYLHGRGITRTHGLPALRFHPRCFYRPAATDAPGVPGAFPALVASVTDNQGIQTGIHRTWLDPGGRAKAQVASPRRALGDILGHAIRFGVCKGVLAVGEGVETMLSLREALPGMPLAAATSSSHLAAFAFPPELVRLYVARDRDAAGDAAFAILCDRAHEAGIALLALTPRSGDFNDDLLDTGPVQLADRLIGQIHPEDRSRFAGG